MKQRNMIPELISDLTRTEKVEIYLKRKKVTMTDIGNTIGVSRTSVYKMLYAKHVSTYRHAQLLAAGLPEALLPPARNIAPGPKPKNRALAEDSDPNSVEQAA